MKKQKIRTAVAMILIAVQVSFVASYTFATKNFLAGSLLFLWGILILSLSFKLGSWIAGRKFLTLQQKREIISFPLFGSVPEMLVLSFTEEPNWIWALVFGLVFFRVSYLLSYFRDFQRKGREISVPRETILARVVTRIYSDPELSEVRVTNRRLQHAQAVERLVRQFPFQGIEEVVYLHRDLCGGESGEYRKADCFLIEKQYVKDVLVDERVSFLFAEAKREYLEYLEGA